MRALFLADLQLGSGTAYGTPELSRLEENALTLRRVVELASVQEVDLVVVAGDVFQHRRPGIDELLTFRYFLDALDFAAVVLVAGNHDVRGPGLSTTIELFHGADVDVANGPTLIWPGMAALPWAHPGALRAQYPHATGEDMAEVLIRIAADLARELRADGSEPEVLVTHYALSGMSLPTGLPTDELREPVLDVRALFEQGWRYVFAGHIHKPEVTVAQDVGMTVGAAVSIGSPWRHDFGEASIDPGVVLLDTDASTVKHVPLEDHRFVTLELEATELDEGITVGGPAADVAGAIVRVRVKCSAEQAPDLPLENVRRNLLGIGAHKVFTHLDVERRARARADVAEDSEPLAAVDAWVGANFAEVPSSLGAELRGLTEELLEVTR